MDLRFVAEQCVTLVADEFAQRLDWSLDSHRVLTGEPYKSLASFGRVFPALIARGE